MLELKTKLLHRVWYCLPGRQENVLTTQKKKIEKNIILPIKTIASLASRVSKLKENSKYMDNNDTDSVKLEQTTLTDLVNTNHKESTALTCSTSSNMSALIT